MSILSGKNILLGVTGSIAVYKAIDLASRLTQAGANVEVIMTSAAAKFVSPLAFKSVTGKGVYKEEDLWGGEAHVLHVGLGHGADLLVIAPCTANTIAKIAYGLADNLLTITALAAQCPILIAPAMDAGMYEKPATAANVATLIERGVLFAGPEDGRMASGLAGKGRFMEPSKLMGHIRHALGMNGPLKGKKIVVTAGGSREAIDPVRYISNRSSGKQGYAIAQAAVDAGAAVTLITHPTGLPEPENMLVIQVDTAAEMLAEVEKATREGAHGLIMAAAVADFTPVNVSDQKIKKRDGFGQVQLTPTEDILARIALLRPTLPNLKAVIGFAAESQNLLENAREKLARKKLDLVVANDITASDAGFGVDDNRVNLLFPDGILDSLPLMSKEQVAETVVQQAIHLILKK